MNLIKEIKMTKQEIKQENNNSEGNQEIKSKRDTILSARDRLRVN